MPRSCAVRRVLECLLIVAAFAGQAASARADVILPSIIGDHMTLQRDSDATLWGWASPVGTVRVETGWNGNIEETTADRRGRWALSVSTPGAGGPYVVHVRGRTTVTLRDVMVGEVWVCSGQSNMEWPVSRADDAAAEAAVADHPEIRLFMVPNTISTTPRSNCDGRWTACTPESVASFSAVGYSFGRELQQELGDVPIGLISADWGGTVAEAWTSAETLGAFPQFAPTLEWLEQISDPERRGNAAETARENWWNGLSRGAPGGEAWNGTLGGGAAWSTMTLPETWTGDLASFDGVVYFRRAFQLDAADAGGPLFVELGPIDDYDDVWVNGVHVGGEHRSGRWNQARRYEAPASALKTGENVVAVRVLDTGGLGGINGAADQLAVRDRDGEAVASLAGEWSFARGPGIGELPPIPDGPTVSRNTPSVLFNGMIAPIRPYTIRGAIWYQGESNRNAAALYRELFPAMIRDWRREWGQGDFPFYFVQIAPFRYGGETGQTALLREAQTMALAEPATGMVVTMDIGDPADIHPTNKKEVGRRLALWALAKTYGWENLVHSGPLYRGMRVDGNEARIRFDHVGDGLVLRDAPRSHFLIAGADQRFVRASARVDGDEVVVSHVSVASPVAVRYGWEAASEPNLFNREGLSASPFRTDGWAGPLPPVDNSDDVGRHRDDDPAFRDLFDGRTLDGWVNVNTAPSTWAVEDGVIACSGLPTGVMRTDRQYENFVLEMEWRHLQAGGNAGLFVWSDPLTARGQPFTRGIEVQVMDGHEADWYTSDGDVFPIHGAVMTPENGRGGNRAFPTERRANASPLWNHYRVTCIDGALDLAVNGKVVTRGRACSPRRGYICLESEGSPVHFRNIRIKELPPSRPSISAPDIAQEAVGFRSLYTGVDLLGWKTTPQHAGHWKPSNWILELDGAGPDLWTKESFRDCVLICDWRWTAVPTDTERPVFGPDGAAALDDQGRAITRVVPDAGDSGIYLRGNSKSQVNIWCWPSGSGEVFGYRTDASMPAAVRAAVAPREAADAGIGAWNRFEITMQGDRLTVVLNGRTVIERAQLPGVPESGPIGLQCHGHPIQFANLYVRELD